MSISDLVGSSHFLIELDFACEIAIRALRILYNDDEVDLSVIFFLMHQ